MPFDFLEISGAIRSIGSFDYKTSQSYTLNVSVTDRGDPPLQSFALVYVNITNINDNKPQCSQGKSSDFHVGKMCLEKSIVGNTLGDSMINLDELIK